MTDNVKPMPVTLISGQKCVTENGEVFRSFGKKAIIVTGGTSAKASGAFSDVTDVFNAQGIEYTVFSEIGQNPKVSSCIKAGRQAREANADFVVGIGGGSVLDAAKAAAICAENPDFDMAALYGRNIPSKALPVILIGTTAGTGSEVTGVAVLTNDETGLKKSISGADCYAAVSFLDAAYTESMPYSVTVSTALDALAHAVEGWFSPKCNALPKVYAEFALPAIYRGLKELESGTVPDSSGRERLYTGSIFAGLELNICGAAFPHTVGYLLTENFGIPHGRACTAFMPYLLEKAKKNCPDRLRELYKVTGTTADEFLSTVKSLTAVEKLPVSSEKVREWCSRFGKIKNFDNTPGGFTNAEAEEAFLRLL